MGQQFPKGLAVPFYLDIFQVVALGWWLELKEKRAGADGSLLASRAVLGPISVISAWFLCTFSQRGNLKALAQGI